MRRPLDGGPETVAQSKARRLMHMRRSLPYVSSSALASILSYQRSNDTSDLPCSRPSIKSATSSSLPDTPYGSMLVKSSLVCKPPTPNRDITLVNPFAYLYVMFKHGGGFFEMFSRELLEHPCSPAQPWRLAFYGDEITPGNALDPQNNRKSWALYFSLLEFDEYIHAEEAWCPITVEPAKGLKNANAGVSQLFAVALKHFFGDLGHDFSTSGMRRVGPDGSTVRIWAETAMFIMDGAAHKLLWGCKGDKGPRCCMLCKNIVSYESNLTGEDNTRLLIVPLANECDLQAATDADIRASVSRLSAVKLTETVGDYKRWEQTIGFSLTDGNIIMDPVLKHHVKPATHYCHDWMHGLVSNGVADVVVFQFIFAVSEHDKDVWDRLGGYCNT